MWYTKFPTMNGPATDHFRRSDEWKRNPPFFVPTATTTLPFLIVRAMSPTCDAGKDVNGVPGFELCLREGTHDDFLVDEDIHVRPASASLVHDSVPDPRTRCVERSQDGGHIGRLEDDLVLIVRVRAQRRRDPDENDRQRHPSRSSVGNSPSPLNRSSAG